MFIAFQPMIQKSKKKEFDIYDILTVFPKVNRSWMDIRSSIGVWITGPSIKFIGHSHTPQRRCSRFLLVIWSSNEQLFFWTKPIFTGHCHMSDGPWEWLVFKRESPQKPTKPIRSSTNGTTVTFLTWYRHCPRKLWVKPGFTTRQPPTCMTVVNSSVILTIGGGAIKRDKSG